MLGRPLFHSLFTRRRALSMQYATGTTQNEAQRTPCLFFFFFPLPLFCFLSQFLCFPLPFFLHGAAAVLFRHDHHTGVPLSPPGKHDRVPDLVVVGLAQRGPPGAKPGVPLARRAQGLVRYQPLAVLLVEHANPAAEDDGVGLAARGRARRGSPRIFVVPRRRLAAGEVSVVREQVGGHGRVDVHAVEVRGA